MFKALIGSRKTLSRSRFWSRSLMPIVRAIDTVCRVKQRLYQPGTARSCSCELSPFRLSKELWG